MHINPVSNQSFEAKPFRIIADSAIYSHIGTSFVHFKKPSKYVMEYKNPRAKELYEKAKATRNISEKVALYEQMGHYELKSLNLSEIIREKFNKFIMDYLF